VHPRPRRLSRNALKDLADAVSVPAYDPVDVSAGILHFGVGNFHRAHQAVYLDDLFNLGMDHDWGIVGAGIRDADMHMCRTLSGQDWLTTVVEQEAKSSNVRVTASLVGFIPPGNIVALIDTLADPRIRIVSLTVTEGGYYISPSQQGFDAGHPDIVRDAAQPNAPATVFGLILAGLRRRRELGYPPFTVMSCDNIPGNGRAARRILVGLARLCDPEFARWVDANVAFPSSMVDRITPVTTVRERAIAEAHFGIVDGWPVFCEQFRQWIVEDHFPAGRPQLERVGVQFVDDVAPFELMKVRILNGGHAAIAYPAALMGIKFVHEAMRNDLVQAFLGKLEGDEIIPTLPAVPGADLGAYFSSVASRFGNPKIEDTIERLCHDGSNRQPKFILATVADRLAVGADVRGLALVGAMWARYCYGETEDGTAISPNDPNWDRLMTQARLARRDPGAWLEMTDIFGSLGRHPVYVRDFTDALISLWEQGTAETLKRYVTAGTGS
jgi:mannitol 2-dehydrogenase